MENNIKKRNEEISSIYDNYSTEQIDEFEKIAETDCCWGCRKRNASCCDCESFLDERDKIVLIDYITYITRENDKLKKENDKLKSDWAIQRAELNFAKRDTSILTQTKDSLENKIEELEKELNNKQLTTKLKNKGGVK